MKNIIRVKKIIRPLLPQFVLNRLKRHFSKKQYKKWLKTGHPVPPPHIVKQIAIQEYKQLYGCNTLVETGTYLGDMIEAQKNWFEKIISIELDVALFEKAVKRFKNDENVNIILGDSGKVLPEIMNDINEPAIFWLDGHYSLGITAQGDKECPVFEELEAIFNSVEFDHILLIDDARCFVGKGDYPSIEELTEYVKSKNQKYQVEVRHDIIRYVI